MTMLVTLEQARQQIRGDGSDIDNELTLKATLASEIVLNFVTHEDKVDWTPQTVPGSVQAAVLIVLVDLWDNRAGSGDDDVYLSVAVKSLLQRYRDPTLA